MPVVQPTLPRTRHPKPADSVTYERAAQTEKQQKIWQVIAAASAGSISLIGYGGAAGGGKTRSIVELAIDLALDFPGNRILIGRKDFNNLKTTTLNEFLKSCPPPLIFRRNNNENWFDLRLAEWPDGVYSRIYFRELKDWVGLGSEELGAVLVDEAGEVPVNSARMLLGRLRHQLPEIIRQTPRTTATPWGRKDIVCDTCHGVINQDCNYCKGKGFYTEGKPIKYVFLAASNPYPGWFEEWFIRRKMEEDLLKKFALNVHFILSLPKDNPHLPPDYEARLRLTWPEDWVKRMMEGRWDAFEGQVYPNFSPDVHQWSSPVPDRKHWAKVVGGLDFGGQNPHAHYSAGMVGILLKSNRLLRVAEFEERGQNIYERQLRWLLEMEAKWAGVSPEFQQRKILWIADRTQGVAIQHWKTQMGFRVRESWGKHDSRMYGITMVSQRLNLDDAKLPGSFYHKDLTIFPDRMLAYRYESDPGDDNKEVKLSPIRRGDDLLDADRYMHEAVDRKEGIPAPNQVPYVLDRPARTVAQRVAIASGMSR